MRFPNPITLLPVHKLFDGRYLYIGLDLTVMANVVGIALDSTPVAQCNYLGRLYKNNVSWTILPETYTEGTPLNGVWDMAIHVDGTPITPWIDLDHTAGTLQPDASKDLNITFGAEDIVENCTKNAHLYFHSTDFFKQETIIDATINFQIGIVETDNYPSLQVYPNPTTGQLTIDNEQLTINNVEVYNIMGKKQEIIVNYQLSTVNCSHLPAGIYFIKVNTDKGVRSSKFVIK